MPVMFSLKKHLLSAFAIAALVPCLRGDVVYTSAAAFAAATANPTTIGFNGILGTGQTFLGFSSLIVGVATFSATPSSVKVNVTEPNFYSPKNYPAAFIIDSANPGPNNELDITLSTGTHALALDYGGFTGGTLGTITLSDGAVFTQPSLPGVGSTDFVGFTSTSLITGLSFKTTGDSWALLDMTLATPVPEPFSLLLLATVVAALGLGRLHRSGHAPGSKPARSSFD